MDERDYKSMNKELNPPLRQTAVSGSVYLLSVPKNQIEWFEKNYGFINDDKFYTDGAEWSRLKNNIFGNDDRFLDYDGNSNSLLEGFWLGYSAGGKSTVNTQYFLDCCLMALMDAVELEFYEIAFNIKTLHNSITKNINDSELFFDDYPSFDGVL